MNNEMLFLFGFTTLISIFVTFSLIRAIAIRYFEVRKENRSIKLIDLGHSIKAVIYMFFILSYLWSTIDSYDYTNFFLTIVSLILYLIGLIYIYYAYEKDLFVNIIYHAAWFSIVVAHSLQAGYKNEEIVGFLAGPITLYFIARVTVDIISSFKKSRKS